MLAMARRRAAATKTMSRDAVSRRMALWAAFVAICAVAMAGGGVPPELALDMGSFRVTPYDLLLAFAFAFSLGDMFHALVDRKPSVTRTMARILAAYVLYLTLVLTPIGMWLGLSVVHVIHGMTVRFAWLLVPTVWALCRNERTMRAAGLIPVIAAAALAVWGLYSAATGGAGFYYEAGDLRFRVLWGGATLLFAWPFVLAVSGASSRRLTPWLAGMSLVGLALTNHRSGVIAFGLVTVFALVASGRWRRLIVWVVPAALVAIIVALSAEQQLTRVFGYTMGSLLDLSSGNAVDRLARWELAWQAFASHPLTDYLWSGSYYLVYVKDAYPPHNFILEIAVTEGLAGLAFYGSVLWISLRAGWGWVRHDAVVRALVAYVIAYLTFSFANATLYQPATAPLLVAAVAAIAARVEQLRATAPGIGDPR
jgi:hypothetical protein